MSLRSRANQKTHRKVKPTQQRAAMGWLNYLKQSTQLKEATEMAGAQRVHMLQWNAHGREIIVREKSVRGHSKIS